MSDSDYMTESQKIESENLAMRPILAKQADEALYDAAVWMQRALAAEEKLAVANQELSDIRYAGGLSDDQDLALAMRAARQDSVRLEFILQRPCRAPSKYGKGWIVQEHTGNTTGRGSTPREALDAVMKVICTLKNISDPRS